MLRFVVWKLSLHVVLTSALIYVIFVAILKKKTVLDKWSEWNETKAWKPEVFHGRSKARINLVASDTKEKHLGKSDRCVFILEHSQPLGGIAAVGLCSDDPFRYLKTPSACSQTNQNMRGHVPKHGTSSKYPVNACLPSKVSKLREETLPLWESILYYPPAGII